MPVAIRGIDEIMAERGRDSLFIEFPALMMFGDGDRQLAERSRDVHFEWLRSQGISWETAAPRGWLEGNPGIYFVDCEPDDLRIAAYTAKFENTDGSSLDPETYRMVVLIYASWRERRERREAAES